MPPKQKKDSNQAGDDQKEPLQAVLLTDSYENTFAPFTFEKPRVGVINLSQNSSKLILIVSLTTCKYSVDRVYIAISGFRWS